MHEWAQWIDPVEVEAERRRLPAAVFAQLWENRWTQAAGSFLDPAMVAAAFTLDAPALERKPGTGGDVAGLDLGSVNDRSVLAVGHRERDTGVP